MNSALGFLPAFLMEWGVRSSVLILVAAALLWLLRVKNPSVRLAVWTVVLAGSLSMPLLIGVLPRLSLPILKPHVAQVVPEHPVSREPQISSGPLVSIPSAMPEVRAVADKPIDWARLAVILYLGVAVVLLGRLCMGLILSLRMLGRSRRTDIRAAATEVRESAQVASPVTIGVFRPVILLPLDWREWIPAKLSAVLTHESSHVRRRDPAVQLLSVTHRALLWLNPLSWLLHHAIVRAAEEISDDEAIAATSDRVFYAETLLDFVKRGVGDIHWIGVPMARHERPEIRIRRILNATGVARGIGRYGVAGILALGVPLAYLAAAARPESTALSAPAPVHTVLAPTPTPSAPALDVESVAPVLVAQQTATPPQLQQPREAHAVAIPALPAFEVATVKPSSAHQLGVQIYPRARVFVGVAPLKSLIATAFGMSYRDISGGEEWTEKDNYDLEAQPSEAMQQVITDLRYTLFTIEDARLRQMLQALLIDRFQLKFHLETKTGDVYFMELDGKPSPLKAKEAPIDPDPRVNRGGAFGSIGYVGGQWSIWDTPMSQLATFAGNFVLHEPILDRTGLPGRFDYKERAPDIDPTYTGDQIPSFRNFLTEMGLKLERGKAPIETLVIDSASKPSAN